MEKINILGVNVCNVSMEETISEALNLLETDSLSVVSTPNSEILLYASNNEEYKNVLNKSDLVLPDGIGVVYGARILGTKMKERVAGFDFVSNLLVHLAKMKKSVYLLGAKPGVAEIAAKNIKEKFDGIVIAGTHDGYFKDDEEVILKINEKSPDFLMVCLGFPKQEFWIDKYRDRLSAKLAIGAGGSIDVFAGIVMRAPEFYCKHGLEWLYRLIKQPSRFVRMLALPKFGLKVLFKGRKYK